MRIATDKLELIAKGVLKRDRFSGGDLARRLGIDYQLLWAYLNRTGLPVDVARKAADVLDEWAGDLQALARALRRDADIVDPPAPARRARRATEAE